MPPKLSDPPPRMTWGRALPVLALCIVFDAIRFMFEQFWFFAPAFTAFLTSTFVSGYLGSTIGTAVGAAAGIGVGTFSPALQAFGLIMAMAVGLLGWAAVTLLLVMMNPRMFKADATRWIWSLAALAVSEVPFVGTLPMLTITHWRLYAGQIRKDKEALKQYNREREKVAAFARANQEARANALRQAQAIPEDGAVAA